MWVVDSCGDRQHLADRLYLIPNATIVDKRVHVSDRQWDSAEAKRAFDGAFEPMAGRISPLRRISFACRNSLLSFSRAFNFTDISVGTLGRLTGINLYSLQPLIQRVFRAAARGSNRHNRPPARRAFSPMIQHYPHRTGTHLSRKCVRRLDRRTPSLSRVGLTAKTGRFRPTLATFELLSVMVSNIAGSGGCHPMPSAVRIPDQARGVIGSLRVRPQTTKAAMASAITFIGRTSVSPR